MTATDRTAEIALTQTRQLAVLLEKALDRIDRLERRADRAAARIVELENSVSAAK